MTPYECPRCHARDVRDTHTGLGGVTLYEFACRRCGLDEDRRSDAADLDAWWRRWTAVASAAPVAVAAPPSTLDAVAAAVIAAPDDDEARLAYAAAIAAADPPRAELIRLQVERAAAERARGARWSRPSGRETELLRRHGAIWARFVDPFARPVTQPAPDPGWGFERGFVEFLRVAPDALVAAGAALFAVVPLQHLDLIAGDELGAALASRWISRVRSLGLPGAGLDDDGAVALAASPHLGRLAWLDLRDNRIGERGMRALAASAALRAIPVVLLGGNPADPSEQLSLDWDGSIASSWLPDLGRELEAAHGTIGWLYPASPADRPDRYHVIR